MHVRDFEFVPWSKMLELSVSLVCIALENQPYESRAPSVRKRLLDACPFDLQGPVRENPLFSGRKVRSINAPITSYAPVVFVGMTTKSGPHCSSAPCHVRAHPIVKARRAFWPGVVRNKTHCQQGLQAAVLATGTDFGYATRGLARATARQIEASGIQ